jgi:hypothetical protein
MIIAQEQRGKQGYDTPKAAPNISFPRLIKETYYGTKVNQTPDSIMKISQTVSNEPPLFADTQLTVFAMYCHSFILFSSKFI